MPGRRLGKDFLKQLYGDRSVQPAADSRQMIDLAAQGSRPIAIGIDSASTFEAKGKGLPVDAYPPDLLREGGVMSSSNANLALPTPRTPTPSRCT